MLVARDSIQKDKKSPHFHLGSTIYFPADPSAQSRFREQSFFNLLFFIILMQSLLLEHTHLFVVSFLSGTHATLF